jgi:hypothetical protein
MDQSLSASGIVPVAERKASIEFYVHALVSILMLSAGLLSITAENDSTTLAEGQSTVYLAMMR